MYGYFREPHISWDGVYLRILVFPLCVLNNENTDLHINIFHKPLTLLTRYRERVQDDDSSDDSRQEEDEIGLHEMDSDDDEEKPWK